jgi:hypothetical protein
MILLKWLYLAVGISYVILINMLMVEQYFNHQYLPFLPESLWGENGGIVPQKIQTHLIGISYLGGMMGATIFFLAKPLVPRKNQTA